MTKHKIIWIIGLPCAGKTTLAYALADELKAEVLDGDELRNSPFCYGLGDKFDAESRFAHLVRIGYFAERMAKFTHVICAFVAPFPEPRKVFYKDLLVFLNPPAEVCERRDVKGMWAKARAGEIPDFTGVGQPFLAPKQEDEPHLEVDTAALNIWESVQAVLRHMGKAKETVNAQ